MAHGRHHGTTTKNSRGTQQHAPYAKGPDDDPPLQLLIFSSLNITFLLRHCSGRAN